MKTKNENVRIPELQEKFRGIVAVLETINERKFTDENYDELIHHVNIVTNFLNDIQLPKRTAGDWYSEIDYSELSPNSLGKLKDVFIELGDKHNAEGCEILISEQI